MTPVRTPSLSAGEYRHSNMLSLGQEGTSPVYAEFHGFKGFGVREFNRVDGFSLSYGLTLSGRYSEFSPELDAEALYFVERSRWGWYLDLYNSMERWGYLTTGIAYYRLTDSFDSWRMGDLESSLASFVLKEAFRNYYEREGVTLYVTSELSTWSLLKVAYRAEVHRSLDAGDPFTIPGKDKSFRENPDIDDGNFGSVSLELTYDTRDNIRLPRSGWYNAAVLELARDWMTGERSFTRWFFNLRRYHPVRPGHTINFRFALGGQSGERVKQRTWTGGGVGTLRGYHDLIVSGDHMILGNIEYRFPTGLEKLRAVTVVFNELSGMVFFDTGRFWFRDQVEEKRFLSDLGVGMSGANFLSYFGLYVAWPLTDDADGARWTIKIQRDF